MHPFLKAAQEILVIISIGTTSPAATIEVDIEARHICVRQSRLSSFIRPARVIPVPERDKVTGEEIGVPKIIFDDVWKDLVARNLDIPFRHEWSMPDDYFIPMHKDDNIEMGGLRASFSDEGRKIVLISTMHGVVMVYKDYCLKKSNVFSYHAPAHPTPAFPYSTNTLKTLMGFYLFPEERWYPETGKGLPTLY